MTPPLPTLPEGLPPAVASRTLAGGWICEVWWAELADGRQVTVKRCPYPAEVEADGLAALDAAGAPVPPVLAAAEDVLVLAFVDGPPDWRWLGGQLAQMHRASAEGASTFGWHRGNLIGSLPQRNDQHAHWPTFFAQCRVVPLLDAEALPERLRARLLRAVDGPLLELLDTDPAASLVHGDLWSANVVDGRWLIDPAVHRADREFEVAYTELFGGFPVAFRDGYESAWPLSAGYETRRLAFQLYPLLVHVALFGASYVSAVEARLDALGW